VVCSDVAEVVVDQVVDAVLDRVADRAHLPDGQAGWAR